jgi:hypothetical protein
MWHPGHRCHICHIGFIEAQVASKARSRNTTYQGESNIGNANTCSGVRIAGRGAASHITVNVTALGGAFKGVYNLTVTNPDGGSRTSTGSMKNA